MKFKLLSSIMLFAGTAMAQNPFPELNENFYNSTDHPNDPLTVVVPTSPIQYDVLFTGGVDYVKNVSGDSALAKEWHDFTGYVPINGQSDSGYVIVNHERIQADPINGDGGGMTVFTAWYDHSNKVWKVANNHPKGKYRNVDFSSVGGTGANCGGIQTSWGKVFTAEEWGSAFSSNAVIYNGGAGITDTSDWTVTTFNGQAENTAIKKHMNFQYMVEVDVENAVAIRKQYNMGRYDHEGGWIASDERTVYLSDDKSSGSVLFKFVADVARDFSVGQLYAYQQSTDGESGTWLPLTMDFTTMLNARGFALAAGATVFMRLEWVEGINDNTVFITETGRGKTVSVKSAIDAGGTLANHLVELDAADGAIDTSFNDIYGRVLRLNTQTGKVEVALEGGGNLNRAYDATNNHLSSPDGLASTVINGRTYLAINEDMNPSGHLGSPAHFSGKLNEVYILDVTGDAPGVEYKTSDLVRFLAGPAGCETTGGRFTPDGRTYFVNIQHPSTSNTPPFNHSVTIAITGFETIINTGLKTDFFGNSQDAFAIYPNPANRILYFNDNMDVVIYTMKGKRILTQRNTKSIDISGLSAGTYVIQNGEGSTKKLVVK